jgi:hypothetical protein
MNRSIWIVAIVAATGLWVGCSGSDLQGTGTPPPDTIVITSEEAELAALWLSGELTAPQDLLDAIAADLHSIRTEYADSTLLASVEFFPPWEPSKILIQLTPEGVQRLRDGDFAEFDSLGVEFGVTKVDTTSLWQYLRVAKLSFSGLKHPVPIARAYAALSDVVFAEPNGFVGGRSNVYPWKITGGMSYLIRYAWGDCPSCCINSIFWYFRVRNGVVEYVGRVQKPDEPNPAWWDEAKLAYEAYRGF